MCFISWEIILLYFFVHIFHVQRIFIPFPNKPWFLRVCSTSLLKTLWEKEKLLVTSNFSFSLGVFYPLQNFLPFSSNMKLSSANSFSSDLTLIGIWDKYLLYESKNVTSSEPLATWYLTLQQWLGLVQIQSTFADHIVVQRMKLFCNMF